MLQLKGHIAGPPRCRPSFNGPARILTEQSRVLTRISSARNGSGGSEADSATEDHSMATQTVEMYLNEEEPAASPSSSNNGSEQNQKPRQLHRRRSMTVAPPRAKPVLQGTTQESALSPAWQQSQNAQMKKLRVELSMAQADLHTKGTEAKKTQNKLRQQDRELARLRAALSERDERLRESKLETTSARAALQSKETEMQQAYQRLTTACSERSAIRRQLIDSQAEAADLRAELQAWSQDLYELRNAIDSLDEAEAPSTSSSRPAEASQKLPAGKATHMTRQIESAASKLDSVTRAGASASGEDALQMLRDLEKLSEQILGDAQEDAVIFAEAAAARGLGKHMTKEQEDDA